MKNTKCLLLLLATVAILIGTGKSVAAQETWYGVPFDFRCESDRGSIEDAAELKQQAYDRCMAKLNLLHAQIIAFGGSVQDIQYDKEQYMPMNYLGAPNESRLSYYCDLEGKIWFTSDNPLPIFMGIMDLLD